MKRNNSYRAVSMVMRYHNSKRPILHQGDVLTGMAVSLLQVGTNIWEEYNQNDTLSALRRVLGRYLKT